ncbi:uncharacterized protein [Nicotiana tomentosiformis]|uniref:uncharacterized protein n=1 Tax=Nicotiana tomentosiformis TaxID=4098 RepID=UPI00388C6C48
MESNADSDAQIASHNTSICDLEVQMGQISQALNTGPKAALPSETVVNLKGENNTGHAMSVTTRSGRGGVASTSNPRKIVNDDVVVQEEDESRNDENVNEEVRIDIDENVEETQDDVKPSREHVTDISDPVVTKAKAPLPRPPPPYPQRLTKQNNENQFKKFIDMMKVLSINVPLVEALKQMPGYAKLMKDLETKKMSMNYETIKMTHQVSAIVHSMAPKLEDPGAFTIPCTIGSADFAKALCDLGASINLIPYPVFKTLGIGQPRPTSMRLKMADRTMKRPLGIIDDVLIRIDKFILPVDFVILDGEVDYEVPIILGRPFLATGKTLVDVEARELTFRVGDKNFVFHVCKSMMQPNSNEVCSFVDLVTEVIVDDISSMMNVEDPLEAVLLNHEKDEKAGLIECANTLQGMGSYTYGPRKLSLDLENWKTPPTKPSIEEPPILELKPLPSHLRYEFLGPCSTLHVIPSSCLTNVQVDATLVVLQRMKKAIGWTLADIRGISPAFCMHTIILEKDAKPSVKHQWRLNEAIQDVIKKVIIKWLDVGVVYPVLDSSWTSLIQCVPKKGGMTVITNEKNKLIPIRTVTGWRVCMDYRKLNKVTHKDHFPLLFLDQILDRLVGRAYYCFLDGYSGYNHILIAPEDQEKTNFTYLYGTSAFSRMPFGLCNAPTTFQRWFYRRFIKDFSKVVNPLCKLLEKDAKFVFNDDCMKAFELLEYRLTTTPIITAPN